MQAENKRLQQECLENRQMISVLELQRDVLLKPVNYAKFYSFETYFIFVAYLLYGQWFIQ